MQALEVRRVPFSLDLTKPGEFVFIPKKEPLVVSEDVVVTQPRGFYQHIKSFFFGKIHEVKRTVVPSWPDYDAIVFLCPH